ncbi:hypothetical protein MSAN_00342800 [Mycena sanguinolenta]|uniref:Uncharacterized protein n=1 Tax=Mycena sanguinolenta TaxID=230812 RepID=A0A8H6ZBI7_9AGAR|nr:hypothetical protein MSAN_00342800 [Mycena sanguinolenta]
MSLHETTSRAESLCARCATTPGLNPFQPMAVSAIEVCRAAANLVQEKHVQTARMEKLAVSIVHETAEMINRVGMAPSPLPLSPETLQILERVETKLDEIRRTIEQMSTTSIRLKKCKLVKDYTFARETNRLKKELTALVNACVLLGDARHFSAAEPRGISPMDLAHLTIRAATVICDAPVLSFLKPVVGIAEIISETAQTVKSNRAAALQLAAHSTLVTRSIAEHVAALGLDEPWVDSEALIALISILSDIHFYLTDLQKPRRPPPLQILDNGEQGEGPHDGVQSGT